MHDRLKRAANESLWGDLDESARVARELMEAERDARDAKSRRLKNLRLSVSSQKVGDGSNPDQNKT